MNQLQGHSYTYRIALGPRQGRKLFTLQTILSWEDDDYATNQIGKMAGFSLNGGVATKRVNVRSWNDCAAISLASSYQKNARR